MPRNKDRDDVRAEVWLKKSILKKAQREAKRRGISRKMCLEEATVEGLKVLQDEPIPELPY